MIKEKDSIAGCDATALQDDLMMHLARTDGLEMHSAIVYYRLRGSTCLPGGKQDSLIGLSLVVAHGSHCWRVVSSLGLSRTLLHRDDEREKER